MGRLRRFPRWAFGSSLTLMALVALAEAFGSRGFAGRDEIMVLEDMARRAYHSPALYWGNGALLKLAQFHTLKLDWDWPSLHWPVLAAMALQAWALAKVGRRLGGKSVAQGAVLAALLSATALLHSRSLLPFAVIPALLAACLALVLQGGWWMLAGGALLAVGFLEYEGIVFALPGFAALLLWEPRLRPSKEAVPGLPRGWALFFAGFALSLGLVLYLCRTQLAEWWAYRMTYSAPLHHLQQGEVLHQLRSWIWGGRPEAYMGVLWHPVPALWALPFIVLGLISESRRRPWLIVSILVAGLGLLPAAGAFEPQRTVAAFPALALAAGFGWRWAWAQARPWPLASWLLLLMPFAGFALEETAFERSMLVGQERYSRSQGLMAAAKDARFQRQTDAMLMSAGLAIESVLGPLQGAPQWVWLPADLGEDVPAWPGVALYDNNRKLTGDTLAKVPAQGAGPLLKDLAYLRKFWIDLPGQRAAAARACRQALQGGVLQTKAARATVWWRLIQAGLPVDALTLADLDTLAGEGFKSPRFYRAAHASTQGKDLRLTYWMLWLMRKNCGEGRLGPLERQILATPWQALPVTPSSPPWPAPGQPGTVSR